MGTETFEDVARQLRDAERRSSPISSLSEQFSELSLDDAYAIQRINHDHRRAAGQRQSGWKVGLSTASVRRQLGLERRDAGAIFDEMSSQNASQNGEELDISNLIQPRIEGEVAFVIGDDLPFDEVTATDVFRATAFIVPALEIVDSRIVDWDVSLVDTVADNASAARFALGTVPRAPAGLDLSFQMNLFRDDEIVSSSLGSDCFHSAIESVVWLANFLGEQGLVLQAGDIVLSGSLGRMVEIAPGQRVRATFGELGTISMKLEAPSARSADCAMLND